MTDTHTHPFRYAAFISYSHSDEAAAGWLHRALEGFKPPEGLAIPAKGALPRADKLAPVFRDREELASGADLPSLITTALEASGALIVLCSPRSAQSQWVNQEIRAFRDMHGDDRIFALIVEGDPADDISCFPPALLEKVGPDGAILPEPREPLAADIRPGKDGKPLAKLKLAAGLMGVGLDDLARREDARARKRMMAVTAASLTGMVFAAGLAAVALLSRQEAVRQRARAETEAMTATRTAEFMIDLFEVADPSEARGREITAKEILDKGVASIETSLEGEPKVQADLMHTMGRVYTGLGLNPDAERLLTEARQLKLDVGATPFEIFETDTALGRVVFERGEYENALAHYSSVLQNFDFQNAKSQDIKTYIQSLAGAADVKAQSSDNLDESASDFEKALSLIERHSFLESDLHAETLLLYARPLMLQEKFNEAEESLLHSLEILENIHGAQHYLNSRVLHEIATLRYFASDMTGSIEYFERALQILRTHLKPDHPDIVRALNNIARLKLETGQIEAAYSDLSEAIEIQTQLGRDAHPETVFFLNTMSVIQAERQNYDDAIEAANKAINLQKDASHRLSGPMKFNLGRALCAAGKSEEGLSSIRDGRAELSDYYPDGNWRYGAADEFESICLAKLSNAADAKPLSEKGLTTLQTALGDDHYFTRRAKRWMDSL
ncbi:MAG: tetratricopeptide repeat protein [Pseudomonadota bacterium]